MTIDLLFSICNTAVLPAWLLLLFLPHWRWTTTLICSVIVPGIFALVYFGIFITHMDDLFGGGGFGSIAAISEGFQNPYLLTMGWVHYLAFDLFIGTWEVSDARRQGIPHWLVVPCLFFTFMLGPIGLGLYLLLRSIRLRRFVVHQELVAPPSAA